MSGSLQFTPKGLKPILSTCKYLHCLLPFYYLPVNSVRVEGLLIIPRVCHHIMKLIEALPKRTGLEHQALQNLAKSKKENRKYYL